jgi:MFS family permease
LWLFAARQDAVIGEQPTFGFGMEKSPLNDAPGKGSLLVIFLTVFIDLLGFGIVIPLLPIYADEMGLDKSGWQLGALMASFSVMQFFCAPLWGRLSDRIGRRPVLMVGLLGSVVFYAMFGISTVTHSFWLLLISRIGSGMATRRYPVPSSQTPSNEIVFRRTGHSWSAERSNAGLHPGPQLIHHPPIQIVN